MYSLALSGVAILLCRVKLKQRISHLYVNSGMLWKAFETFDLLFNSNDVLEFFIEIQKRLKDRKSSLKLTQKSLTLLWLKTAD